jgi:hypothetical protein
MSSESSTKPFSIVKIMFSNVKFEVDKFNGVAQIST